MYLFGGVVVLWFVMDAIGSADRGIIVVRFFAEFAENMPTQDLRLAVCNEGGRGPLAPWVCRFNRDY